MIHVRSVKKRRFIIHIIEFYWCRFASPFFQWHWHPFYPITPYPVAPHLSVYPFLWSPWNWSTQECSFCVHLFAVKGPFVLSWLFCFMYDSFWTKQRPNVDCRYGFWWQFYLFCIIFMLQVESFKLLKVSLLSRILSLDY